METHLPPPPPYITLLHTSILNIHQLFRITKLPLAMRLSCNGCRVLRKGCNVKCSIKPCLEWIKSSEAQSNATLFLAKFYGRAGLLNLIGSGPDHLRPNIFRSLLYEACGRIVNPIYGSTGLLASGNWQLCQNAVEAVLSGAPIVKLSPDSAADTMSPSLKACDIRHVSKEPDLHKVKSRTQFKRRSKQGKESPEVDDAARVMWSWCHKEEVTGSPSRESGLSQQHTQEMGSSSPDVESDPVETVKTSLTQLVDESDVRLELTLGLQPL